ncbi:MAG: 16S rRNA (uracil(1498)-N(3))-methyltransferase [Gammaproteobacteria bacterium]|nr:16S rRNA (uracil(1498)-N(3))-methyltransferase [Gammaproteobacteria bacterium]
MAEPLFFSKHLSEIGATLILSGDEAHHALAARRLQPDEILWLFDGQGGVAQARLQRIGKRGRELELRIEQKQQTPAPKYRVHLACALPKGDRQNVLLDMATQLGMTHFTPLLCERSVVKPGAASMERWQRICLEACKQSRRLHLPAINNLTLLAEFIAHVAASKNNLWIAHPETTSVESAPVLRQPLANDIIILVGPEGGFTAAEIELASNAGAKKISLGSNILRIEAAAVALLAVFAFGRSPAD